MTLLHRLGADLAWLPLVEGSIERPRWDLTLLEQLFLVEALQGQDKGA